MTSGLETEWDNSGRRGRGGLKKKISKANERKRKVKRGKDEEVNGQGRKRGALAPNGGTEEKSLQIFIRHEISFSLIF